METLIKDRTYIKDPVKRQPDINHSVEQQVKHLADIFGLSLTDFLKYLPIAKSSYYRIVASNISNKTLTNHITLLNKLVDWGKTVSDSNMEIFKEWMHTTNYDLGQAKPIEFIGDAAGVFRVIDILNRIEYGIYS